LSAKYVDAILKFMEETKTTQPTQTAPAAKTQTIVKKLPKANKTTLVYALVALLVVVAGAGTGWLLSGKTSVLSNGQGGPSTTKPGAKEAGIADEATFRDTAEGILEEGGVDGEGTHHLVREGGPSKYVYLTSTVIDLESFVGKNVQVWGETISAQTAGWLMDVGKVKVLD
jgi:hypothetical protein